VGLFNLETSQKLLAPTSLIVVDSMPGKASTFTLTAPDGAVPPAAAA